MNTNLNPYESPTTTDAESDQLSVYETMLVRRGLLHRRIQFAAPLSALFDYDGKYFRQRLFIDRILVWRRISWTTIHRRIDFVWPESVDSEQADGRVEIRFRPGLVIRRFTVYRHDEIVYDEQN